MELISSICGGRIPELVLFDLDGTLIDSVPDLADAVDCMLQNLQLATAGEERVREWVGNGAQMLVRRALAWAQQLPDATEVPQAQFGLAHQSFLAAYRQHFRERTALYDGVREGLEHLGRKSIAMAVVTNKPVEFVAPLLAHFGIAHHFGLSLGGDSLPAKKPNPLPLVHACAHFTTEPERALMIGDSRNDVEAARACRMPVICLSYGYNHGEPVSAAAPDAVIDSLRALL